MKFDFKLSVCAAFAVGLVGLLFPVSSIAQLELNQSSVGYLTDTPALMHKKSGTLEQDEGEDLVWDFSDLGSSSTLTLEFEEVDNVEGSNLKDGSEFFLVDDVGIKRTGVNLTSSSASKIAWRIMGYSTEIGTFWNVNLSFWQFSTCNIQGNSKTRVKGNGTLILPTGVFTNVTRYQVTTEYISDCLNGPTSWNEITLVQNYYFKPGCHVELLSTYDYLNQEWYEPYYWESCSNPCLESTSSTEYYYYIQEESIADLCFIEGCADEEACNYVSDAIYNEGCLYEEEPCDDGDELTEGDAIVDCQCTGVFVGDIEGDGIVGVDDLLSFLSIVGCTGACDMDLNSDAIVNMQDLLIFLGYF